VQTIARSEEPSAAVGAVLAGGRGERLGGAKAAALLGGLPLIARPLAAIEAAGLEPLVVAKRCTPLPPLSVEVVLEPDRPRHPLRGIVEALRRAGGRAVVVVGCDMPLVDPGLLRALAAAPEALVVPRIDGELQPLLARYDASLLPPLERALRGSGPLRATVESLGPRVLDEDELERYGDPRLLGLNVNTPADLVEAERLLAGGSS
jgi:molybdopterin-guanine dinucleotide biosynthesis protein A